MHNIIRSKLNITGSSRAARLLFHVHCASRWGLEPTPLILIENTSIPQSKSVKFLDVILDQHLSWNAHIAQFSAKVAKNIGILPRISYKKPPHAMVNLY